MSETEGRCEACGCKILWMKGRTAPVAVDPILVDFVLDGRGPNVGYHPTDKTGRRGRFVTFQNEITFKVHGRHSESCPKRDQFQKKVKP